MTHPGLYRKLNPSRFPNMSPQLAAIVGYVLDRQYTTPALADLKVTHDGLVEAWPLEEEEAIGPSQIIGHAADLRSELRRLGRAAGLDAEQWASLEVRVRVRIGIELGGLAAAEHP